MDRSSKLSKNIVNQKGGFLIVAMIMLIIIATLGIATLNLSITNRNNVNNFNKYKEAQIKAAAVVNYAISKIQALSTNVAPNLCNQGDNNCMLWNTGQIPDDFYGSSKSINWWETFGTAAFISSRFSSDQHMYFIAEVINFIDNFPQYTYGFRIIGHATDASGSTQATFEGYQELEIDLS